MSVIFHLAALISCSLLCLSTFTARANPWEENPTAWEYTAATGVSYTSGNSDSTTFNLQFLGTYRDENEEAFYGADYFYAEFDGFTSTNSFRLFGTYNRNLSEKIYLGSSVNIFTNQVSGIDYRIDLGPTIGYYFLRDSNRLLSAEIGLGYAFESKDGETDNFLTYRAAQHFDYKFSDRVTLRQAAILTPKATDPASYIFNLDAALDIRLHGRWNLRAGISHRIDLDPAIGSGKDDTLLTLGLSYSLNGFLKEKEDRADQRKTLKKKVEKKEGTRDGWTRNAAITTSTAKGNSDNLRLKFDYDSAFRSKENEFFLKAGFQYAESNGQGSQNRSNFGTRYNWKFSPATYAGIGLNFLHDDSADLSYRFTPGAHIGHYVILNNYGGLSFEGGFGYTVEERGGLTDSYLALQAAQRLYWQIGAYTYVTQEIAWDAPADDPSRFNINSYLYLDTIISDDLHWRVGVEYYYNSTPATGAEKGDLSLSTGIALKF